MMGFLSLDGLKAASEDPRQYKRLPVELTVTVWLIANDASAEDDEELLILSRTACVENLSLNGLYFVSHRAFAVGSLIGIRMRLGSKTYALEAIVRRSRKQMSAGNCLYGCGVQFVQSENMVMIIPAIASYLLQHAA